MKKYKAIIDRIISGTAGPVTKATGIRKRRNEKILISLDMDLSFSK